MSVKTIGDRALGSERVGAARGRSDVARPSRVVALGLLLGGALFGCQSAEERCNEARVEAYDAWTAHIAELERLGVVAETRRRDEYRACIERRGSFPREWNTDRRSLRLDDSVPVRIRADCDLELDSSSDEEAALAAARRVPPVARGGAIPFHETVDAFRAAHGAAQEGVVTWSRTVSASDALWESCRSVSP